MMISNAVKPKTRRVLFCIYGAALLYFVLKLLYYAFFIGGTPDEGSHIGYLIELTRNPALIPDFASLPMYRTAEQAGGQMLFVPVEGSVNYLGHPSLYYLFMTLADAVTLRADGTALVDVRRLRAVNILLAFVAVVLAFRIGYRKLKGHSPLVHLLYAAAVAALPMLGYVSSGVSNDNLAFPAFAVFFTGVIRYDEDKPDFRTYALIGTGFLLGSFSKLTAAMIMLIMLITILAMSIIRNKSLKLIANRYFLMTLPCYLLFLAYEIVIYRRYGAFQPSLEALAPEFYRTTVFYVAPENRVPMTFFMYLIRFAGGIGHSWSSVYSDPDSAITVAMHNGVAGIVYWIPVAAAVIAAVRQMIRKKADWFTIPAVLAFFGTLAYHLRSGWSGFLKSGYPGGAQARYYLFLILPFALIFALNLPREKAERKKTFLRSAAVILLVILWLLGDAPRMLLTLGFPAIA
ncbi:MAG: hypothetical protein IKG23_10185 [Clostridia bacterium]|nr:hypothetical protein [Clostridia bacterium]